MIDPKYFENDTLPGRLYPVIKDIADELGGQSDAIAATNVLATNASQGANVANQRLVGDTNFYKGTFNYSGTVNGSPITAFSGVTNYGISYGANGLVVPYSGVYAVYGELTGDCVNTRTDWYQEPFVTLENAVNSEVAGTVCSTRLPPNGTWNMRASGVLIFFAKASGEQWKFKPMMTTGGSTTNGLFKVYIKKVV